MYLVAAYTQQSATSKGSKDVFYIRFKNSWALSAPSLELKNSVWTNPT